MGNQQPGDYGYSGQASESPNQYSNMAPGVYSADTLQPVTPTLGQAQPIPQGFQFPASAWNNGSGNAASNGLASGVYSLGGPLATPPPPPQALQQPHPGWDIGVGNPHQMQPPAPTPTPTPPPPSAPPPAPMPPPAPPGPPGYVPPGQIYNPQQAMASALMRPQATPAAGQQ